MFRVTVFACLFTSAVACQMEPTDEEIANGEDPLRSLESTVRSSRYGKAFWREQLIGETETWSKALAFCQGPARTNYPNCEVIAHTRFLGKPRPVKDPRTAPGFGLFPRP